VGDDVRTYEMMYILRPDLDEEQRRSRIARVEQLVAANEGQVTATDEWGSRLLAYEIDHFREGYYVLLTMALPGSKVRDLEGRLRMEDEILRFQVIRLGDGDEVNG